MRLVLLTLLMHVSLAVASPAEAVVAASADLSRVPAEDRVYTQYFSLYAVPERDRPEFLKVFAFHVNSLSRKARLKHPLLVTPSLLRVDIRDYRWKRDILDKLSEVDPYFHQILTVEEEKLITEPWPGGIWPETGVHYPANAFNIQRKIKIPSKKNLAAIAPWLPTKEAKFLVEETQSKAPILRADWFLVQTAVNAERVAGYYAFLELKSRQDFFDLIGFDLQKAQKIEREVAAIVQESGISIRNRQVYRFGATDSGYWQTRDVFNDQTKRRNAINALNGDFQHDAEEHYGFLANRLFVYYLSDRDGKQQDTAPDQVGPDTSSPNNDHRVHIFKSCVTCHTEGIRPIDDYGRKLFQGPAILGTYDKKKFDRLEQLYLLPLQKWVERDTKDFSDALAELNGVGWTPAVNANAYKKVWKAWAVDKVTPEIAARELGGVTSVQLVEAVRKYATPVSKGGLGQLVPNVLLAFVHDRPLPMLREHYEESYGQMQLILRGLVPAK